MSALLICVWLIAQTAYGVRRTCVTGGVGAVGNTTECYNGSSWVIIPSLSLSIANYGHTSVNLGSIACLVGGSATPASVFCTNWSAPWVSMPSSIPYPSALGSAIYGVNWIAITTGAYSPSNSYLMRSSVPQDLTPNPEQLNLAWPLAVKMPNLGQYTATMNLNGTFCLFGGEYQSGSICLEQSSGTFQWVPGPTFDSGRHSAISLLIAGQWCAAGGDYGGTTTIECIDETASFQDVNFTLAAFTLPIKAYRAVNITIDGLSCMAGGLGSTSIPDVWCANVSAANSTVQWLKMANLTIPRYDHSAWTLDAPTLAPTLAPTTSPTASPTVSPTTSPTSSPTLLASLGPNNKLSAGEVAGIIVACVIVLGLCLVLLLWWYRTKRGHRSAHQVKKNQSKLDGEQRPLDLRETALDSTLSVCDHILKDPQLSTQERLLVQVVMAGAEQNKKELSSPPSSSSSGIAMTSVAGQPQKNEIKEFNIEDFKLEKFLSQGEGGTAELYKHRETGHLVAIKTPFNVNELEAEARVWANVGVHPNVARLIGIANLEGKHRGIIMEYYEGGSLASQTHELSPGELVRVAIDLARGLQHLHRHKVIHRDLAPRNILVAGNNKRVAITDFGLSRQLDENDNYQMSTDTKLPWRTLAPELIAVEDGKRVFTEKTDIWALGVTLWELATKKSAYTNELEKDPIKVMKEKIGTGKLRLDMKPLILKHAHVVTAVVGCLQFNPALRPSAEQLRWLLKDEGSAEIDYQDYLIHAQSGWVDTEEYA